MARVTVEDCLENVDNRFELIMVSTKRARQLATGGKEAHIEWENDKCTVVALREIAEGYINASILDDHDEINQQFAEAPADQEVLDEVTQTVAEVSEAVKCKVTLISTSNYLAVSKAIACPKKKSLLALFLCIFVNRFNKVATRLPHLYHFSVTMEP